MISTRSCTNPIHSPNAAEWMTGSGITIRPIVCEQCRPAITGTSLPMPNLSKFRRLVWPKFVFTERYFLTDRVFVAICLLEKSAVAKM